MEQSKSRQQVGLVLASVTAWRQSTWGVEPYDLDKQTTEAEKEAPQASTRHCSRGATNLRQRLEPHFHAYPRLDTRTKPSLASHCLCLPAPPFIPSLNLAARGSQYTTNHNL